jgi:broad specificity phosphatase PhoE
MKTVYFVRHGSTPLLEAESYQEHETPLSSRGRKQAETVAKRFKTIDLDVILSSEMRRAHETAEAISAVKGKPVEPLPIFNEVRRPSAIRGRRRDAPDVSRIFNEITDYFGRADVRHSDEENFFDLKERAEHALSFLEARPEERILVVTHGVFLKMLMTVMAFGEATTPDEFRGIDKFFFPGNTGVTKCTLREGRWRLITWSDDAHLGEIVE